MRPFGFSSLSLAYSGNATRTEAAQSPDLAYDGWEGRSRTCIAAFRAPLPTISRPPSILFYARKYFRMAMALEATPRPMAAQSWTARTTKKLLV